MKEVALIGKGYWGVKMFESICRNPNFKIKYHLGNESRVEMLKDKDVEAVFIATPIKTHFEIAKECMLAGKHVYSAKPLATEYWEILQLIDIAETKGLHISVDYTTTFSAQIPRLNKELEPLGRICYMSMENLSWGKFNQHNVWWLYASHMLAMLSLFKDLDVLSFKFDPYMTSEYGCDMGRIRFDGGDIFVSRLMSKRKFQISFFCERGILQYSPAEDNQLLLNKGGSYKGFPRINTPSDIDMSVQYFHDVLTGKEKSNIEMAKEITKIISTRGGVL